MTTKEITFYESKVPTDAVWCLEATEVFNDYDPKMKGKILPVLSIDMGSIKKKYKGVPVHFIHHDISLDWLKFKVENGKYTLIDQSGKLPRIQELSEVDKKKKFLKTEADLKFEYKETLFYNEDGLLVREESLHGLPRTYTWENSPTGPRLASQTIYMRGYDVVRLHITYTYDDAGIYTGKEVINVGRSIQLKEEFEYQEKKNGKIKIVKKGNKDSYLSIKITDDETEVKEVGTQLEREYCYSSKKELKDLLNIVLNWGTTAIVKSHNDDEKTDITPEVSEDGKLLSIFYDYSSEEKLDHTIRMAYDEKENGSFELKEFISSPGEEEEEYNTYVFTPEGEGYKMEQYRDGKHKEYSDRHLGKMSKQQAIMIVCTGSNDDLFLSKDGLEPELTLPEDGYGSHREYEGDETGKVRKVTVSSVRSESNNRASVSSETPIPWQQKDATPLDSKGNKMEYIGMISSGNLFGHYYLFYSPEENVVTQIFQCT